MIAALAAGWFMLWCCHPPRPHGMDMDMWLCWRRAQSRWEWARSLAVVLTSLTLLLIVCQHRGLVINDDMARLRNPYVGRDSMGEPGYHWALLPNGEWKLETT